MIVALFFAATVASANLPPRYYYPTYPLTPTQREVCNALADKAYNEAGRKTDSNFARIAEVDAFEACAKKA